MLFGKKKKDQAKRPSTIREAMAEESEDQVEITEAEAGQNDDAVVASEDAAGEDVPAAQDSAEEPAAPETTPQDVSEITSKKGYVDFGALLVPAAKDQKVRLDIDQKSKRVVSLTIAVGASSIQLQAFSAPKSGGIWQDVRQQIEESVVKQKGRVKQVDGPFGRELHARVPTVLKDGRKGWRAARFIGFEGSRWFLRGVIGGRGAIDRQAAQGVEELFSKLVVVRGDEPLPPRELLKLSPPAGAKRVVAPRRSPQSAQGSAQSTQAGSGASTQQTTGSNRTSNRTNGVPQQAQGPGQQ